MDAIQGWISVYGYPAIFCLLMLGIVGLPIPDETLLVFSGYLIFRGRLQPAFTVLTAFLGSACGITISYFLGRTLGLDLVHKYGRYFRITEHHIQRVHDWFERLGHWLLVVGYFMPGIRHFSALVAGTSRLHLASFMIFAYSGALIWVSTFLLLGYFLGENWARATGSVHRVLLIATIVLVAGALIYYLLRRKRKGKELTNDRN